VTLEWLSVAEVGPVLRALLRVLRVLLYRRNTWRRMERMGLIRGSYGGEIPSR
jgi:hypothetical protein